MKYIMVTDWNDYWDKRGDKRCVFTVTVFRGKMREKYICDDTETLFIKRNPSTQEFEKAWMGKVKGFSEGKYRSTNVKAYFFDIELGNEVNCHEYYKKYPVGWYKVDELMQPGYDTPKDDTPKKLEKELARDTKDNFITLPTSMSMLDMVVKFPYKLKWQLFLILCFGVLIGIYAASIPFVRNLLNHFDVAGYTKKPVIERKQEGPSFASGVPGMPLDKDDMKSLMTSAYKKEVSDLEIKLIEYQANSKNKKLSSAERNKYAELAKKMEERIAIETENYSSTVKLFR